MAGTTTSSTPTAPVPRVEATAPPRVPDRAPPRVATTSNDILTPTAIRNRPCLHQRLTRNNNPFAILHTDDDDDESATDDETVITSNCSQTRTTPPLQMTNANLPVPSAPSTTRRPGPQVNPPASPHPTIQANVLPRAQRRAQHRPVLPPRSPPTRLRPTPFQLPSQQLLSSAQPAHDLRPGKRRWPLPANTLHTPSTHTIEPDDDLDAHKTYHPIQPQRRSTRLISSRYPSGISRQAIHHVMQLEAKSQAATSQWTGPLIDIEEY